MSNTRKIKVKKPKEKSKEKDDELTLMVRESLGSMGRSVNPYQEKMLVCIYKLFIIGGITTIIDFVLFIILKIVGLPPVLANAISFTISLIYGLWSSFKYAFKDKKKDMIEYLILALIGLAITELLLWFIRWMPILIKFFAIILVIVVKIFIKKFILKRK